jgi:hypothetical protein
VIHLGLLFVLLGGSVPAATTHRVWLVVGASAATPSAIAHKANALGEDRARGLTFQTADCGEHNNVFGWALEVDTSIDAARQALARARATIKGAYIRRCEVRVGSLLDLNLPVVDPSIAEVPNDVVNWTDEDRISNVSSLADGLFLVIAKYYEKQPDDEVEGRRQRLLLVDGSEQRKLLDDCQSADAANLRAGRLTFECASEQAGAELMHRVFVFDREGNQLVALERCRDPRWVADGVVVCSEESVGPDGTLKLRDKRVNTQRLRGIVRY